VKDFWRAVWEHIKAAAKWLAMKVAAPGVALLIVVGAIILVAIGFKDLQIGGLLGKILGKAPPEGKKVIDVANTIPKDRVDPNGNLIPIGKPDSVGDTQIQVVPIDQPGLFSNPDHVTFTSPGETTPTTVVLPDGVKAKDVDQVVIVKPDVVVVTVKDNSGVTPTQVDDLLKKYGG
jgi:hypothetical protein